jgi:hypothetical protein
MQFDWSPRIGDPTVGGWLTVILYVLASVSCWRAARKVGTRDIQERRGWQFISVLFLALGVNKQLDLQSALTEAGRVVANIQGWYAQRALVQLAFIVVVAIICTIAGIALVIWARRARLPARLALIGTILVLCFVLVRAASFHHVDRFISTEFLGLRWNWILEMGGIAVVLVASGWQQHELVHRCG